MLTLTRPKRALLAALAALAALIMAASPAFAANGSWYSDKQTNKPVIYQTNLWYESAYFSSTDDYVTPPSNATINKIYWRWKVIDTWPAGTKLNVYLCAGSTYTQCLSVKDPNSNIMQAGLATTAFNGFPANTQFRYIYQVSGPSTVTIPPVNNGGSGLQVDFTY